MWLGKMGSKETRYVYRKRMKIFCGWCGLDPQRLLALKDDPDSLEAEHLLDRFVASRDFTDWQKVNIVTAVKSFFTYNYRELQRVSGKVSAAKQTAYRTPTAELLREFIKGAWTIRDKALVAFIASAFFREGTIPKLNWNNIEGGAILKPDCNGIEILHIGIMGKELKGGGKGRYAGIEQHAFLTPEVRDLLLDYKRWREIRGEKIEEDGPIFVTEARPYRRIGVERVRGIFKAVSRRSGVKFSPHDFRRYGQTQLEEARLPPNWIRKILGHKVKGEENPYSRPKIEQLREAYRKAIPHLVFIEKPKFMSEVERRKKVIMDNVRLMGLPDKKIKALELLLAKTKTDEDIDVAIKKFRIRKIGMPVVKVKETQANGGDCQRIVEEPELGNWLSRGWRVVDVLRSGKVVVESPR